MFTPGLLRSPIGQVRFLHQFDSTDASDETANLSMTYQNATVEASAVPAFNNHIVGNDSSSTDYMHTNYSSVLNINGGVDWCIEGWYTANRSGGDTNYDILSLETVNTGIGFFLSANNAGGPNYNLKLEYEDDLGNQNLVTGSGTLANGSRNHIAIVREDNFIRIYENGGFYEEFELVISAGDDVTFQTDLRLYFSTGGLGRTIAFDSFRMVIGQPVYTADFAVPTAPFTTTV